MSLPTITRQNTLSKVRNTYIFPTYTHVKQVGSYKNLVLGDAAVPKPKANEVLGQNPCRFLAGIALNAFSIFHFLLNSWKVSRPHGRRGHLLGWVSFQRIPCMAKLSITLT